MVACIYATRARVRQERAAADGAQHGYLVDRSQRARSTRRPTWGCVRHDEPSKAPPGTVYEPRQRALHQFLASGCDVPRCDQPCASSWRGVQGRTSACCSNDWTIGSLRAR